MKNLCFMISALLVTSMAFSADNEDRSTIDKSGKCSLRFAELNYIDINEIRTIGNAALDRRDQPVLMHMYVQNLMKIPTAYNVICLATLDMSDQDPACAESMLTKLIPQNEDVMSFAILATMIGEAYLDRQQYDDAARLFITSWKIQPSQIMAQRIIGLQAKKGEYRGMAYWYAQAKKEDCLPTNIHDDMMQIIMGAVNKAPDQKTDFNKDIEDILSNETSEVGDLYNPEYLLFRKDM